MTQHLHVGTSDLPVRGTARYLTACGRWVISAQATGPGGVTCKACKNTDAWREATK